MGRIVIIASALAATVVLGGCASPEVVEGTVVGFDETAQVVVVRDELAPDSELIISIADATVGAPPEVGDVVRIAYEERADRKVATRVMNISRQDELAH
jgi:hypothetical protein